MMHANINVNECRKEVVGNVEVGYSMRQALWYLGCT